MRRVLKIQQVALVKVLENIHTNFIQETIGAFGDQIRGFIEPFVIMKDVVFDLLKPFKLLVNCLCHY